MSKPDLDTLSYICGILHVTASYFLQATIPEDEVSIPELKLVKKYRYIAKHSPNGAKTINAVLENEYAIAEQLEKQKDRIEELETSQATVIDIQTHLEVNAAHARTDIDVTDEMIKHDDDIMDDDDF